MDEPAAEALLELASRAQPGLDGLDRKALFAQLEERHDELVAAIEWFLDHGRTEEALRLANALARFWTASGRLEEGSGWFGRVLAAAGGTDANRGRACFEAGLIEFWRGDDDRASMLHGRALEIGRAGDRTVTALALTGLARVALRRNDVHEAQRLCRDALAASEGVEPPLGRANALNVLGVAAQMAGDPANARQFMSERMALARQLGQYGGIAAEAANLAMVEHQLGNFDRAATLVGAAEAMMTAQGTAWPPDERPHYELTIAKLVEAMGPAGLAQARAEGRKLRSEEAVKLALSHARPD